MKRIIFIVLSALVLTMVHAAYACAQWKYKAHYFDEGLAYVQDANDKYGFINEAGKLVIPCKWKDARSFSEGLAVVVDDNGKFGFIDKTGKVVIPCKWKWADSFSEGLARVEDANGKWGFINKSGKVVIPCKWKGVGIFYNGLVCVKDASGKYGFINKKGKVVIPCKWEWAADFREGLAEVEDANGNEYKIDKTGRIVSSTPSTPSTPSVDPNSMSWPKPSYDSGWELKNERLFSDKKCWNRGLIWNGGNAVQIIKEIDEHSGRVKHYWLVESGKVYKNENDAEGAAYFYSVYGLKRTRGEVSNFY